jgi:hypothetical protein
MKLYPELRDALAKDLRVLRMLRWRLAHMRKDRSRLRELISTPLGSVSRGFLLMGMETQFACQIKRVCAARKVLFAAAERVMSGRAGAEQG